MHELGVHHLALRVRDLAGAEAFWTKVLGRAVCRRQDDEHGRARSIWVELDRGAFLALERADAGELARTDEAPGWHCVALGIDAREREAWRARLAAHGYPIERETAYTLYVREPGGALVGLSHYPEAAPERAPAPSTAARVLTAIALVLAMLAGLWAPVAAQQQQPRGQRSRRGPPDVLMIGSSSINGPLGVALLRRFQEAGLRTRRIGRKSTGFARPDYFDWQAEIPRFRNLRTMRGVLVYMGGNDTYALRLRRSESRDRGPRSWISWHDEERWTAKYVERVRTFMESLCSAGARRVILLLPTDGDREVWSERIRRVQSAQIAGARNTSCGVIVDPRGRPVEEGDTIDGVHLSTRAATELMDRIGPAILSAIVSAPPARPEPSLVEPPFGG